jgi:hypothetical protein
MRVVGAAFKHGAVEYLAIDCEDRVVKVVGGSVIQSRVKGMGLLDVDVELWVGKERSRGLDIRGVLSEIRLFLADDGEALEVHGDCMAVYVAEGCGSR